MPVILALQRGKQENRKFKVISPLYNKLGPAWDPLVYVKNKDGRRRKRRRKERKEEEMEEEGKRQR